MMMLAKEDLSISKFSADAKSLNSRAEKTKKYEQTEPSLNH
jgi:hypothetical protein